MPAVPARCGPALVRCTTGRAGGAVDTGWVETEPFDDLVASWAVGGTADVDVNAWVRDGGEVHGPFALALRRAGGWSSVAGQRGPAGEVDVDRLRCGAACDAFRLAVDGPGASETTALAAVVARLPVSPSPTSPSEPIEVAVEPLSQLAWAGTHPELDGGGASWCSPTSLAMVLRAHGVAVEVPDVARAVFDPVYGGCGNWSLNVAHAASLGVDAVVTRLTGLDEAASLLRAGLPLVVSIAAAPGALPGFPLASGTAGHLVVLAGIDAAGDPIVHDPAAAEPGTVRRVYPAARFVDAWVGATGGITYLLRPPSVALPPTRGRW